MPKMMTVISSIHNLIELKRPTHILVTLMVLKTTQTLWIRYRVVNGSCFPRIIASWIILKTFAIDGTNSRLLSHLIYNLHECQFMYSIN